MRKYLAFAKVGFLVSLVYRTDNFLYGISETIYNVIFIFVWIVLFSDQQSIAGFNLSETITYMIGVGLINGITATGVARDVEQDINKGSLSIYLVQPVSYLPVRIIRAFTEDWLSIVIRIVQVVLVGLLFRNYLILNNNLFSLIFFIISIIFAFIITQFSYIMFGFIAFWTITAKGSMSILRVISTVFSGNLGPISFFPRWFQIIAGILPFYYVGFWPMLIYLGKVTTIKAIEGLGIQILWIIILLVLIKIIWSKGIKKYEGVGI